jgi:hypothetical protein
MENSFTQQQVVEWLRLAARLRSAAAGGTEPLYCNVLLKAAAALEREAAELAFEDLDDDAEREKQQSFLNLLC